jgi:hypothetical protein
MLELLGNNLIDCTNPCELSINTCNNNCLYTGVILPEQDYCLSATTRFYEDVDHYSINTERNDKSFTSDRWVRFDDQETHNITLLLNGKNEINAGEWLKNMENCDSVKSRIDQDNNKTHENDKKIVIIAFGYVIGPLLGTIVIAAAAVKLYYKLRSNSGGQETYTSIEGDVNSTL